MQAAAPPTKVVRALAATSTHVSASVTVQAAAPLKKVVRALQDTCTSARDTMQALGGVPCAQQQHAIAHMLVPVPPCRQPRRQRRWCAAALCWPHAHILVPVPSCRQPRRQRKWCAPSSTHAHMLVPECRHLRVLTRTYMCTVKPPSDEGGTCKPSSDEGGTTKLPSDEGGVLLASGQTLAVPLEYLERSRLPGLEYLERSRLPGVPVPVTATGPAQVSKPVSPSA